MSEENNKWRTVAEDWKHDYSLSISDLILVDGFKEKYGEWDVEGIEEILYQNGMDTTQHYELVKRLHRNLQNKVVDCIRYEGVERCDKEWLMTGAASPEAHIKATTDYTLREELRNMSKEMNRYEDFVNRSKGGVE